MLTSGDTRTATTCALSSSPVFTLLTKRPSNMIDGLAMSSIQVTPHIKRHADSLFHAVRTSTHPDSPKPSNWSAVSNCCLHMAIATAYSGAPSTRKKDDSWHRQYWLPFTRHNNMNPFMSKIASSSDDINNEAIVLGLYFMWVANRIQPRSTKNVAAKPDSVMAVLHGCKRKHQRSTTFQFNKESPALASRILQGCKRLYLAAHGQDSLQPERKHPFVHGLEHKLRKLVITPGTRLGSRIVNDSPIWCNLNALMLVMEEGGFRKGEVCATRLSSDAGINEDFFLMRSHLTWYIKACGGHIDNPSPAQFAQMQPGDFAVLRPCQLKNDQFLDKYGALPIYLRFEAGQNNAAAALVLIETRYPVHGPSRASTPLFCSDVTKASSLNTDLVFTPFSEGMLNTLLKLMLSHPTIDLPQADAVKLSWHSYRITLACKLLRANTDLAFIQRVCRWESVESVHKYARIEPEKYMNTLLTVRDVHLTHLEAPALQARLPTIDEHARWELAFNESSGMISLL